MMELKESKTYDNLLIAFSGESQARNKYTFYADKARSEGYEQIGAIFEETANNEKEHAEIWFKLLGAMEGTNADLIAAAEGEHYEWTQMYKDFAGIAREEGFNEIASKMDKVAGIEKTHEERFRKLLSNMETDKVFKKEASVVWHCTNCGYETKGNEAPKICPVCGYNIGYFQLKADNY